MNKTIENKSGHGLALILAITLILLAVYLQSENNKLKQRINDEYAESFYELIEYADNVETMLAKARICSTAEYSAKTLTEIWREANLAGSSLSKIPLSYNTLSNAVKFLNQVSDYSYALSRKTIENEELTNDDYENIKLLHQNCQTLNETLQNLETEMVSGGISWGELTKEEGNAILAQEVSNMSKEGFGNIEKTMQEYEGLIYDGPFSEHMTKGEPQGLGTEEYDEEKATEIVYNYISKDAVKELIYNGTVNGEIEAYSYSAQLKNSNILNIDITKKGGHVLWMNYNRNLEAEKISIEEAKKYAQNFLLSHGFKNMKESYYSIESGTATINYAATQSGVICYPDLIKIKVALDTGEIVGMESKGYLNNHRKRELQVPKITAKEARKIINPNLKILSENLSIIPTEWKTEILAYEYKGEIEGQNFIVYINAQTGKEEKVFLIIDSENGQLAI